MWRARVVLLINIFTLVFATYDLDVNSLNAITTSTFTIWPNATVPFYVEPQHFDHEQTLSILTALSMFAFKTCIKFKPVMARPMSNEEVLVFINPEGIKRCSVEPRGHSVFAPHRITLGYDCLKSPQIDMMLMKSLGFPFEHNRITRDMYIEVLHENIEPGAVEFFTKEDTLPLELRFLPYDINSVMHFGNREYSKNGHRTILFKDPNAQQNRVGLSTTDLKKIEMVYGPECRARDRQEKIELCQSYPGVARKKRETDNDMLDNVEPRPANLRKKRDADSSVTKNLRVNPNITPPPANKTDDITETLKELGVDHEVQEIVEQIYKVSALALKNARGKYCHNNDTPTASGGIIEGRQEIDIKKSRNTSDILGIIELVAAYTRDMVDDALKNLTRFCEESESMPVYQRRGCDWGSRDPRCRDTYKSTKSGPVKHSTQHRPVYVQSTKHKGGDYKHYLYGRARNDTNDETETKPSNVNKETTPSIVRRKRDLTTDTPADENDGTNKQETSKTFEPAVDNFKANNEKKDVGDGKGDGSKENEREAVTKNNDDHVDHKAEETETKKEAANENKNAEKIYKNENKDEVKEQNNEKEDDKQSLRMRTQLPGLHDRDTGRYNRRSGKKHRAKRINQNPVEEEYDSMDAETETPKKRKLKKKAAKKNHVEAVNRDKKQDNEKLEENTPKEIKREDRTQKRKSKKKALKERQVESEESVIDDENVGVSKESEIEEKPKIKKRVKKRQRNEEQMVPIAEEDDEKSTPPHKTRKEKRRGSLPTTVKLSKKNEEFYNERRWPQGRVNYIISDEQNYDLTEIRKNLAEVNSILKKKTCVSLNEITPGQANKYEDYIVIDSSPDYVTGRVGGKQKFGAIDLFQGGQHRQHTAMMVMAMLGFYFEVARHDRDKYIRVHMRHVRPDKLHHFEMIRSDATLPLAYDYASATHPAWQFWRQLGRSGISTVATYKEKDPDGTVMKSLGQNKKLLSDIDIVKINSVYGIKCFQNPRATIDKNLKQNNETTYPTTLTLE